MIIDRIDALEALAHYDIRVARSKYVDSADDALAFAARRTAPDQRLLPIRLYGAFPGVALGSTPAFSESPFTDRESIEDAYRRLAPKVAAAGGRVVVQDAVPPGTEVAIEGSVDQALEKVIAVRSQTHRVEQMAPLDSAGAATLAANFEAHHHHGSREHVRRMLEHLLLKVSRFFEESAIERFELDPVRLHENTYAVLDAIVVGSRPLHVKHDESDARDRKGHYRPSGRQ